MEFSRPDAENAVKYLDGGVNMTVREIVKAYLVEHRWDGLCSTDIECGCDCDEICALSRNFSDCVPARKVKATAEQAEEYGVNEGDVIYVEVKK